MAPDLDPTAAPAEPDLDAGAATEPQLDALAPEPDPSASADADPYADFGGRETVEKAHQLHQALQTEEGVWNVFFQAGRALGLGTREIEALFAESQGEPEPEGPADDDVMTFGQFKTLMDETVTKPQQLREQQLAEDMARTAIDQAVEKLGITDPELREAVLQLGDRYLGDDISPAAVKVAVEKGFAAYQKLVAAEKAKYTQEKRDGAAGVPKAPAGAPATQVSDFGAEPKNAKEAIARGRARIAALRAAG
jgi:hypothetical protein